jgi:hypothetical protein
VERLVQPEALRETGPREFPLKNASSGNNSSQKLTQVLGARGYVALAVSSEAGTATREVETGLGTDREANMIAFAVEALKLVRDCLTGQTKL